MGAFPSLPFPTSNNAPQPIPGGFGNPTGANTGGLSPNTGGLPFPATPAFGSPAYNVGAYGTGAGLTGLNSGLSTGDPGRTQNLYNMLGKAYGKGTGQLLGNLITQGLFNPQVATAFLNAQQPGIARGEADLQTMFGDAGARFGSSSAIGMGDYLSQVQLNQQQTLASLFENAQSQELTLLQNVLPTIHQERANEGGGILHDIIGGLEIAGGIAAAPFSGGASLSLASAGVGTLLGGGGSGGGGSSAGGGNPFAGLAGLFNQGGSSSPGVFSGGSVGGVSDPALGTISAMPQTAPLPDPLSYGFDPSILSGSGADILGGSAVFDPSMLPFPMPGQQEGNYGASADAFGSGLYS